jgi:ubiquinone/menaquinone biosynthesis C-methylase UbiE
MRDNLGKNGELGALRNKKVAPEVEPAELCPWWICFTFDNCLRRRLQNPTKIISVYVKEGWKVLDVGPGMGYFTIPLAKMVGTSGKVIAADLQKHMLDAIHRRAVRARVQDRIILHQTKAGELGLTEPVDFCLAFWMVHEVRYRQRFLSQIASILKPSGTMLVAEPKLHVSRDNFTATLTLAQEIGFVVIDRPKIFLSNAALLKKGTIEIPS